MRHYCVIHALTVVAALAVPGAGQCDLSDAVDSAPSAGRVIKADPNDYRALLRKLLPGDTLLLEPGEYAPAEGPPGLPIFDLHGQPERPVTIAGPEHGPRPVFRARDGYNTVRIANAAHVVVRNLELDGQGIPVDAVKAQGPSRHITLENLLIRNHGHNQQTVGISTKAPAWYWTVRRNVIEGAGTGMYFGDSDGSAPFVGGTIEYNVVRNTIGYNLQIKHQLVRSAAGESGERKEHTIIRHNVFSKERNAAGGAHARPNVLLGHFPPGGAGANDIYLVYGNFFYYNPSGECLFQGEGNIALYTNLFVNPVGSAVCLQPHNDVPRTTYVLFNTVVAQRIGIRLVGGDPRFVQRVAGNAVFAEQALEVPAAGTNVTASMTAAARNLVAPFGPPGAVDLRPLPNKLLGPPLSGLPADLVDLLRDFDGAPRDERHYGAYAGNRDSGWTPTPEAQPPTQDKRLRR